MMHTGARTSLKHQDHQNHPNGASPVLAMCVYNELPAVDVVQPVQQEVDVSGLQWLLADFLQPSGHCPMVALQVNL